MYLHKYKNVTEFENGNEILKREQKLITLLQVIMDKQNLLLYAILINKLKHINTYTVRKSCKITILG